MSCHVLLKVPSVVGRRKRTGRLLLAAGSFLFKPVHCSSAVPGGVWSEWLRVEREGRDLAPQCQAVYVNCALVDVRFDFYFPLQITDRAGDGCRG